MSEPVYSVKEIIELQFKNLSKEMTEIKSLLKDQNVQVEKQFTRLDTEIKDIRDKVEVLTNDNARYKLIIGIGATLGASAITFVLNKLF